MREKQFKNFGESIGRKGRTIPRIDTTINIQKNEDEEQVNKNDPRLKKFKTVDDVVTEDANEIVISNDLSDYQEVDNQEEKIKTLKNSILNKNTKAHVEHFDNGNVASISLMKDTGIDNAIETNPEEWKHLSLKRKIQTLNFTDHEKIRAENKSWHSANLNSRQRLGQNSYYPGDNLKTISPQKKERSLRTFIRQIFGKDKSTKEKYIQNQEDFLNHDFITETEEREHPMSNHWKDEE